MSLADDIADVFLIHGIRNPDAAAARVRELERRHAEAVRLLREAYTTMSSRYVLHGTIGDYLDDHDKRTGTGEPVRPARGGDVTKKQIEYSSPYMIGRSEGAAAERRRLRRMLIRATQKHGYSIDVFAAIDKATRAPKNITKRSSNKLRKDTK